MSDGPKVYYPPSYALTVYLSGDIHTSWREELAAAISAAKLPITLVGPNCVHKDSDDCGNLILGKEEKGFWYDYKSQSLNAVRNRVLMSRSDVVVVRFLDDPRYPQWDAAFEAGLAVGMGKQLIVMHDHTEATMMDHKLKTIDVEARAVVVTVKELVDCLAYVTQGTLQR
jgi:YtoQ family protein